MGLLSPFGVRLRLGVRARRAAAGALFGAVSFVVVDHAVTEKRREVRARDTIAELVASLDAVVPRGHDTVHVSMNGAMTRVAFASAALAPSDAVGAAADACGKDEETGGGEVVATADSPRRRFVRQALHRDDAADGTAGAILCVFESLDTHERRERLTLVRGMRDGSSSVTTITRESPVELSAMFPVVGDAPGADLAGVPRPSGSRRVIAASVVETGHTVVIYESADAPLEAAARAFDAQMSAAGFASSPAVAAKLDDARLYVRADERIVASFERTGGTVRVALARVTLL
jgi:hypothetical protein